MGGCRPRSGAVREQPAPEARAVIGPRPSRTETQPRMRNDAVDSSTVEAPAAVLVMERGEASMRGIRVPRWTLVAVVGLLLPLVVVPAVHAQRYTARWAGACERTWLVPPGTFSVHITAVGGSGARQGNPYGACNSQPLGGSAARVSGDVSVTPGQTLYIV